MALECQAPDCDHEFDDAIWQSELEAQEAGATPFFTRVHDPDDGLGVATDYVCSADCMRDYLDDLEDGEDDE